VEGPKENQFSSLKCFPKGPLIPLLARAAFILGRHSRAKDRVGLKVAHIFPDNVLRTQRTLGG